MRYVNLLLALTALYCAQDVRADNWGHWRGDKGNGVSLTAKPPIEWSDTKNVKWKVDIPGLGSGSPVVWDNRVFVVSSEPTSGRGRANEIQELAFKLYSFDRKSGEQQWVKTAIVATPHERTHGSNNFASGSPCTDGKHVYAFFGSRGLFCYTMDGELKWQRQFGKMQTRNEFGEGGSPTLYGDMIIVPWDHNGPSSLAALNKETGKPLWVAPRDEEPSCWATPLVVDSEGKKQVVMNGQTRARAYDLETGKELWSCPGQTQRPVASPVAADGLVFVGSGHRGSYLGAFRLGGEGNIQGTDEVVWSKTKDTPDLASLVLSNGRLYYTKAKVGVVSCVDAATGKPHYKATRIKGLRQSLYASPIAAGGYLYVTDRSGTTVVIKDADEFEIVATNSVGETVDATPAPVDNELFIRGESHLFCIGTKDK